MTKMTANQSSSYLLLTVHLINPRTTDIYNFVRSGGFNDLYQ